MKKIKTKLSSLRFFKFCIIGAFGVLPNYLLFNWLKHIEFNMLFITINVGWLIGILGGMISNYILNEYLTFNELRGVE